MGIHYDYKSTRGEKALKKKLKEKLDWNRGKQKEICTNTEISRIKCMIFKP